MINKHFLFDLNFSSIVYMIKYNNNSNNSLFIYLCFISVVINIMIQNLSIKLTLNIPFRWLRIIVFPLAASLAFINILKMIIRLGSLFLFPWQVCTHVPVCFPSPFLSWYCYYSCAEWRSGRMSRVPTRAKAFSRVEEEISCRKTGKADQGGIEVFLKKASQGNPERLQGSWPLTSDCHMTQIAGSAVEPEWVSTD